MRAYHWEPPSSDPAGEALLQQRRLDGPGPLHHPQACVPNRLQCAPPLRDDGLGSCQMPAPSHPLISVAPPPAVRQVNAITLAALPLHASLLLTVRGSFFRQPLTVTVGGRDCLLPELLLSNASDSLCSRQQRRAWSVSTPTPSPA